MTMSIADRVLSVLVSRLSGITVASGYNTNAGLKVLRARRVLDTYELPAIVVWNDGEAPDGGASGASASMTMNMNITVDLHVLADQATTGADLELIRADAKRALLVGRGGIADITGQIGTLTYVGADNQPRSDGQCTESVALHLIATYQEAYGDPTQSR